MQAYLKTDPKYAAKFKVVWLWNEFPGKFDLGGVDTGIDIVALTHEGDHWAVQCKCYQEDARIDKPAVDSFLATSSREFKNENLQTTCFAHRLWISTTNHWGSNASEAIRNQNPPVTRINLSDLIGAPVDWDKLDAGVHGEAARTLRKSLLPHQEEAVEKAHAHFQTSERGKLIMACGTGKTFNALRIAESETDSKGLILFLVPSIALLGQALREWSADANEPINAICICSDPKVSVKRTRNLDKVTLNVVDLALPASTDSKDILRQFRYIQAKDSTGMTVVFSTYQSIDVIAEAQTVLLENGFNEFDLIICDEAHRTTGVTLANEDESAFTKVHDNEFIQAKKRLYMTATPRLYSDDAKSKAAEADAILCSMDDPGLYGEEIYRIGFGEAVERDLLTDYKVLILTLSDADVPPAVQDAIANNETEIRTDDVSKLIGCINALSKQFLGDDGETKKSDPAPMQRAVAFCQSIAVSKTITAAYNQLTDTYLDALPAEQKEKMVSINAKHIDGTMTAPDRDEMLGWLKASTENNECRVLTNVRVLSEGVDVPSLDAVLFISAKNSQVDVVQSVGRVMRRSPGKKYGYIIIPVVVPADVPPEKALDDNERYKVVWTVLNALRAHDDRFNATVNKIDLNKKRPPQIVVGGPEITFDENGNPIFIKEDSASYEDNEAIARQLMLRFEELQTVIYARMVQKVGDRLYWEQWAKDVAAIVERQIERINYLVSSKQDQRVVFETFVAGLQRNINPSITEDQAVEMLGQHIITQPIFEALFDDYSFAQSNPVSTAMQRMLDKLEGETLEEDSAKLERFYESVKKRAADIDNAEGKQRIIIELYDKFFKTAFPKMVEQLGIVYTPVEIVDFIIHSVNDVLKWEFERSLSDENVHILDPFTGTGTFMTRLLQSDLISSKDFPRKYREELHANEIVLLAYYIAAVNIENAYHDRFGDESGYEPFEGIVLTDTFQLGETDESQGRITEMFPQNSARVARQKNAPLRVILGNPPYSLGQKAANDNAPNRKYEELEDKIARTYATASSAALKRSLYNSYIKAFRWSTDRLDPISGGVIAFVTNGQWLDGNSLDGFRKIIEKEFSSIWVFNLRGNARTSGELRRKERGNVFGGSSQNPIAITLLVKNPKAKSEKAVIRYYEVEDYLTRDQKLAFVRRFASLAHPEMCWEIVQPNDHGEWLNQRNDLFDTLIPLGDKANKANQVSFFVPFYSLGLCAAQDAWCYNSNSRTLATEVSTLIDFYNCQRQKHHQERKTNPNLSVEDSIEFDSTRITWTEELKRHLLRNNTIHYDSKAGRTGLYRPFFKQHVYFTRELNKRVYQIPKLFPNPSLMNHVICISGKGGTKGFSVLISNCIPDLNSIGTTQCFPLYYYEEKTKQNPTLFESVENEEKIRRHGITDFILERARTQYGKNVVKEDIFYYVYGLLHSSDYRTTFANNLNKTLPRLPLVDIIGDFWKFSKAGRRLADLHINYETVSPYEGVGVWGTESGFYRVEKMRYPKKGQTDTILYNSKIAVTHIPAKAYEYVVNGKSAIAWIMDRYRVTVHKASGIKNDPNDWAEEVGNPRYILDMLLSIINVSVQTVDIVNELPKLKFE